MARLAKLLAATVSVLFIFGACDRTPEETPSPVSPQLAETARGAGQGGGTASPTACDVVVPGDESTVQDGIDAASSGETVCVEPGTYDEQLSVDKAVTVQGRTAPRGGNPAMIDGWVSLDADGAGLRRMAVTRSAAVDAPSIDAFGVRVTAGNTVVAGNVVRSVAGESKAFGAINGIQVFGGEPLNNIEVSDNFVRDLRNNANGGVAGIKLQADLTDVSVTGNRVTDLHGYWGFGIVLTGSGSAGGHPKSVTVVQNTVERVNDGSVFDVFTGPNQGRDAAPFPGSAFGIDGGAEADEATLRYNNLLAPNGAESKDQDDTLVAECNWWGHRSGPSNAAGQGTLALERGSATIDFMPWLISPSPGKACNGGVIPTGSGS